MTLNYDRAAAIMDQYRNLEAYEAYYLKNDVRYERFAPLAPDVAAVLKRAFRVSPKVLDVGCGRGATLLDNAHLFQWAAGLDESREHMIAPALADRDARGIRNVDFYVGKAVALPFDDATFDLVFSERGPLGHSDPNLIEALRVLQTGGLIFIETGFGYPTLLQERERFVRLGIDVQLAACHDEWLVFADWCEHLRFQCIMRRYMNHPLPAACDHPAIDMLLADGRSTGQAVEVRHTKIWVGGAKGAGSIAAAPLWLCRLPEGGVEPSCPVKDSGF